MEMNEVRNDEFRTKGYIIVRNVLSPVEVETMRQHADAIAADLEGYSAMDKAERDRVEGRYPMPDPAASNGDGRPTLEEYPEVKLTDLHARRENRVYPLRRREVCPDDRAATATGDPYSTFSGQINHLADNNEYFRSLAAHPNIMKVLHEVLSPTSRSGSTTSTTRPRSTTTPRTTGPTGTTRTASSTSASAAPPAGSPSTA